MPWHYCYDVCSIIKIMSGHRVALSHTDLLFFTTFNTKMILSFIVTLWPNWFLKNATNNEKWASPFKSIQVHFINHEQYIMCNLIIKHSWVIESPRQCEKDTFQFYSLFANIQSVQPFSTNSTSPSIFSVPLQLHWQPQITLSSHKPMKRQPF